MLSGHMFVDFLNTLILLGALQGFIFSFILFFNPKKRTAEKVLAVLLLLMSLASLNIYLTETVPHWQMGVFLSLVPTMLIMAIGPLIYFYFCFVLKTSSVWKRKYWFHFVPVLIDVAPIILGWVITIGFLLNRLSQNDLLAWGNSIDQYNTYTDIPRWLSITVYLWMTKQYFTKLSSDQDRPEPDLKWIGPFLNAFLIFQLIWFVFLVPYIVPATRLAILNHLGYYPIYVPLTVFIYALGIKGYLLSKRHTQKNKGQSIRLSPQESKELIAAIRDAMDKDKLYLKPNLELDVLVNHIGSDQRTISHVLNHYLSMSFNSFINQYRVEEVKQRMVVSGNDHLKISGIAFECGFNSQSTFQRAFKRSTGLSPREYLSKYTGSL